jgi:hypothetical protein
LDLILVLSLLLAHLFRLATCSIKITAIVFVFFTSIVPADVGAGLFVKIYIVGDIDSVLVVAEEIVTYDDAC